MNTLTLIHGPVDDINELEDWAYDASWDKRSVRRHDPKTGAPLEITWDVDPETEATYTEDPLAGLAQFSFLGPRSDRAMNQVRAQFQVVEA